MDTAHAAPSISPSQLARLLGRADAPLLLDVRRTPVFLASDRLLPGARHCPPEAVADFARRQAPRTIVTSCAHGHGVGQAAAATLLAAGWDARWLAGGVEAGEPGVDAESDIGMWRAAPLPRLRKRPDLGVDGRAGSRWITRARPRIDRIACPWLIRRFIDPGAEFFYVPEAEVFAQAARLGAVPYDIEGAPISHEGTRCSFDALLAAFDLHMGALEQLATIVRGADTDRLALAPESAGLLALSLGLSRLHGDDHAMLAAALPLYDALFEWCRHGRAERHDGGAPQPVVPA